MLSIVIQLVNCDANSMTSTTSDDDDDAGDDVINNLIRRNKLLPWRVYKMCRRLLMVVQPFLQIDVPVKSDSGVSTATALNENNLLLRS